MNEASNVLAVNAAAGKSDGQALVVYASARIDTDSSQFASHRLAISTGALVVSRHPSSGYR